MATTFHGTGALIGADLLQTTTDAQFAVGTRVEGTDGSVWEYVQANGAITQYHAVAIDESGQAASLTTALANVGHKIAIAQNAFADNEYGWVARCGTGSDFKVLVAASCAADTPLYTSATAGVLDDTATARALVNDIVITATDGGSGSSIAAIASAPLTSGNIT